MDFDSNDKEKENNESASISSDLIRGHINTIILRTLYDGDKYGYEIINEIEEKSKGQYTLKQPTLYSALKRLETQDFVTSYWGGVSNGGRRKYFQLTEKGKIVAEHNLAEWEYSRTVIDNLISEREFDFNKPAPAAVDFNLLKKSTTRVRGVKGEDEEDIDLSFDFTEQAKDEPFSAEKAIEPETADEPRTLNDSDVNEFMREQNAAQREPPADEPSPLSEEGEAAHPRELQITDGRRKRRDRVLLFAHDAATAFRATASKRRGKRRGRARKSSRPADKRNSLHGAADARTGRDVS